MEENKQDLKHEKTDHPRLDSPDEKPLKKARYLWEVKGKKHLRGSSEKHEQKDPEKSHLRESNKNEILQEDTKVLKTDFQEYKNNKEEIIEQSSTNNLDQVQEFDTITDGICNTSEEVDSEAGPSRCCFANIIEHSSDVLDKAMDSVLNKEFDIEEDRSNEDKDDNDSSKTGVDSAFNSKEDEYEDYLIWKWQARQIARGYVENMMNTMIETEIYENSIHPMARPRRISSYENAHSSGHLRSAEPEFNVEHEAIFEAIKTHGLQSKEDPLNTETRENRDHETKYSIPSEPEEPSNSPFTSISTTSTSLIPSDHLSDSCEITQNTETSDESVKLAEVYDSDSFNCEDLATDPMDFLNAAVSVAIQKKGLTCG